MYTAVIYPNLGTIKIINNMFIIEAIIVLNAINFVFP